MGKLPARMLEWSVITCVLAGVFLTHIGEVRFHTDESLWINHSRVLELVLSGDVHSPEWQPSFANVTQPPIAKYVIGLGRMAGGYGADALNEPWDVRSNEETNRAQGRMPTPPMLWWSRLPMALAAILSGSILIFCARMIAGRLSGYVLLVLLVTTPYYALHLRRAMGESLLLLGIALVIVTGYGAVRSWHAEMRRSERAPERANFVLAKPLMWLLLFALASGLAGATKLNGLALVGAGIALCMVLYWKSRTRLSYGQAMVFLAAGLLLLPTLTAAAFTVVNPFLYPHPVDNFRKMLSHRVTSIQEQQAQFPDATIAMRDIRTRVRVIPRKILNLASPLKNTIAVKLLGILAIVGLAVLVWHAAGWWRDGWIRDGEKSGLSVVLLLVAVVTIGPALLTPLDWDRYYLPPVVFASLCAAVAVAAIVTRLRKYGIALKARVVAR